MCKEFGLPENPTATQSALGYASWMRTFSWVELEIIGFGQRVSFPYEWWLDDRQGDSNDEYSIRKNIVIPTQWILLVADNISHANRLDGDIDYLDRAEILSALAAMIPGTRIMPIPIPTRMRPLTGLHLEIFSCIFGRTQSKYLTTD